jgi:F420-dependent oxidoreductase-like protein
VASMSIGTSVGFRGEPDRFKSLVHDLEAAGVDHFWAGEAYSADGVSTMGFLAAITERATIGSSILPFYSRTPTLLAMTALGIHKLSGGRCILGIGASGPQVVEGFHGVPYDAPLARTREIVDICRMVWRGEKVVHDGAKYQVPLPADRGTGLGKALRVLDDSLPADIPIYVASLGPKNVELTAAIADGWLPIHYWPERVDVWSDALAAGAAKRAADRGPLQIVAGGQLCITDDYEELRGRARATLAFFFGGMGARSKNFYNDLLGRYGYQKEAAAIQDAWLGDRKREAIELVPQEMVDATSLVGPEGFVRERVEAYRESGVTILNVEPAGPNKLKDIERVREWAA